VHKSNPRALARGMMAQSCYRSDRRSAIAAHQLTQGQVVGGFRLDAPLDAGGMASFWRVSRADVAPGDDPAPFPMLMKVPLLRHGEDQLTIVGFEVERMILARLSGPHVPRFVAAGDFEQPYIVMEFVPGRPLKSLLGRVPLPPEEVASIGARVAYALHDLHRQHVIHLDLKPSNVILRDSPSLPSPGGGISIEPSPTSGDGISIEPSPTSGDGISIEPSPACGGGQGGGGEAVLIDFGLSRHDQLPDLVAEEFDGAIGTGAYVAPEQVIGDRSDHRSDIFSLGVILYFLASGERPYGEPDRESEWRRRLWRDPQPPRRWNRNVPPWLQETILRCMEIDPARRYGTAAQLAFDLQHPADVPLTGRSTRHTRDGWATVMMRWLNARRERPRRRNGVAGQLARAPIVMAAVDLSPGVEPLAQAIASAVGRLLATEPGARVTCVNVLKRSRIALDPTEDAEGRNLHLRRLIELKHWAQLIAAAGDRITYHVLEAVDPAAAIVAFARHVQADHIVIGARGSSTLRRYLGSVSAQVVAEAPCTVTVVRTPH
jgi:serine/threonine protein kinase/nucleotide-binding universal stress UspA family protein